MPDTLATLSEKVMNAELAQKKWVRVSINDRINSIMRFHVLIHENRNKFVELLIQTIFKPKKYAVDEVDRTLDMTRMFCEAAQNMKGEVLESGGYPGFENNKKAFVSRQPLGTVLCISPFNYPLNESMNKIIPALLMGNAVLFKPASRGFEVGELIAKCFQEAELPEGVFNLVEIRNSKFEIRNKFSNNNDQNSKQFINETMKQSNNAMESPNTIYNIQNTNPLDFVVSHPLIDCINFTGSTATAEHIAALCGIKKLIFGLSGKDASLVFNDADVELAAREIVGGAFSYSGQRCTGIKRVLVQEKIYDQFISNLKFQISNSLVAGDLNDEKTTFGPVISAAQADFINDLVADAENLGASIFKFQISNSKFGQDKWKNQFVLPTILERVTPAMRLAWEEPFGPVLPVMKFKETDEAIRICNQSSFGLQNSIFTKDINLAFKIAEELVCGVVNINGKDARGPDNFPFLGVKKSGLGVVGGIKYLLEEMSALKSVVINKT